MPPPNGRILVAFDDPALTWNPTWTAIDQAHPNLVTSYSIDRGRQYELDRTDTGRAVVEIADTGGILDPTNTASPYFGKIEPLKQILLRRYNPVAATWEDRYRGFIEELEYALDPSQKVYRLTISCIDIFEILSAINMYPGQFGDDPTSAGPGFANDVAGQVWYGPVVSGDWRVGQTMEARITRILQQAGIPSSFYVVFSGNVIVQPQSYSPGESAMSAIQETSDAEFPGVSNVYTDRHGRLCVHGRLAKFDPAGVLAGALPGAWDFHAWKAGDGGYVASAPATYAHVRDFAFSRGLGKVINHALATPANIQDADVQGQVVTDATSIGKYGYRSWSSQSLLTYGGLIGATSALVETKRFATYYVSNYKNPQNRVSTITFRSIQPTAPGASEAWRILCQADVSDTIQVYVDAPSSGGFVGPDYFIEGVHEQSSPANALYDDVTMSLDLSPRAYFGTNPWGDS